VPHLRIDDVSASENVYKEEHNLGAWERAAVPCARKGASAA
jgi:hypothetical protein